MSKQIIKKRANAVDVYIGKRLRCLREAKRVSQTELADFVGVSFQQVQKYEKGDNRIGGSMFYNIALALRVTPQYFFMGLPGMGEDEELLPNFSIDRRILNLAQDIEDLPDKNLVKGLHCLVRNVKYGHTSEPCSGS